MVIKAAEKRGKISLPGTKKPTIQVRIPQALVPAIREIVTAYQYRVGVETAQAEATAEKVTAAALMGETASLKGVLEYAIEKVSILKRELEEMEGHHAN